MIFFFCKKKNYVNLSGGVKAISFKSKNVILKIMIVIQHLLLLIMDFLLSSMFR